MESEKNVGNRSHDQSIKDPYSVRVFKSLSRKSVYSPKQAHHIVNKENARDIGNQNSLANDKVKKVDQSSNESMRGLSCNRSAKRVQLTDLKLNDG